MMSVRGKHIGRIDDAFTIQDVGSTLLEELAKGLYQPEEVIREYVQNAVDAHRLWTHESATEPEGPVQIELGADRIAILDYGIGMDETEIRSVKAIAVSPKKSADIGLTGHKGVGIWAGLSYFESLTLSSTKRGVNRSYQLSIDFKGIVEDINDDVDIGTVLNRHYRIDEYEADPDAHFTNVELRVPIRAAEIFQDAVRVRDAVRRYCPCDIDPTFVFHDEVTRWYDRNAFERFAIEVDGVPVYRSYPSAVEGFKEDVITVNDRIVARYWHAVAKKNRKLEVTGDQLSGFRIILSGFVLGNDNPYSEDMLGMDRLPVTNYLRWYVGEIHVVSNELRPDLARGKFEESEPARQFIRKLRDWYKRKVDDTRQLSEVRNRQEEYDRYSRRIEELELKGAPLSLTCEEREELTKIKSILQAQDATAAEKKASGNEKIAALKQTKNQRAKLRTKLDRLLPVVEATASEADGHDEVSNVMTQTSTNSTTTSGTDSQGSSEVAASRDHAGVASPTNDGPIPSNNGVNEDEAEGVDDATDGNYVLFDAVLGLLEEILAAELGFDAAVRTKIISRLKARLAQATAVGS